MPDAPATVNGAVSASPTSTSIVDGAGEEVRPGACSALGMVSAKWVSEDRYELQRSDLASIINSLRELGKSGNKEQLAPAQTKSGKPGLRVLGVGSKAECGLASNDVLVTVNDIPVSDGPRLASSRERLAAADEIKLVLERDGATKELVYTVR